MQFLVFGKPEQKLMDNGSSEEVKRLRVEELAKTREYYSKGLLRNIWVLGDHKGVICLFEADSIEQLNELIAGYPLSMMIHTPRHFHVGAIPRTWIHKLVERTLWKCQS